MIFKVDERLVEFACLLADEARKVLVPYYRRQFTVEHKHDLSPVTEADKAVEQKISQLIKNKYPRHGIIGEEFGGEKTDAEFVWVIDPIDGTKSFITGRPLFGTLISLVHEGKPVLGLIDQPILRERWLGVNGVTEFNGEKVATRQCAGLKNAYFATTSPFLFSDDEVKKIEEISKSAKFSIYGGDCYSYAQLAIGRLDLVIESGLKPYDFCALAPVIEFAGGRITDWEGEEITINSNGKILACGDAALSKEILNILIA
jgi:inositol-phosphate phosphatase/L-galactose 1-phosphate phosphatase/histidinol-phosphatase